MKQSELERDARAVVLRAARTLRTIVNERATSIDSGADLTTLREAVELVCEAIFAHDNLTEKRARRLLARAARRDDACAGELMAYGVSPEEVGR